MKTLVSSLFVVMLLFISCNKLLDEKLFGDDFTSNYYTLPSHAESAVYSIYPVLRFSTDGFGTYGASPFMMHGFLSGMARTSVAQEADFDLMQRLAYTSELKYARKWWEDCYKGISNANVALKYIPNINMDEERKKLLLGEARFFRAYFYFILVRLYGDVPIIVEPVESLGEIFPQRSPVKEVYDEIIIPDLEVAEESGMPNRAPDGRVSMGAVKTLFADVYLTMAGYPLQETDKYALAAQKANDVIQMGEFSLFQDAEGITAYDKLRDPNEDNKEEHIFMAQRQAGISDSRITAWLLPRGKNITSYSDEFGSLYPTQAFYDSYENGDKRTDEQQFFYESFISMDDPPAVQGFEPHIFKFFDEVALTSSPRSSKNWGIYRYAEVLLIYAEAQNEADGSPNAQAQDAINEIRTRAGLNAVLGTQEEFRKAVWRERYWELCFENKAWYDMLRTRKAFNTTTLEFNNLVGYTPNFSGANEFEEKHLLLPIPQREIDVNSNLTQNTGY